MATQGAAHSEPNVSQARTGGADGHAATDVSDGVAPRLKVRLRQWVDSGKGHVSEWRDGAQGGIRERPIQSVLIAVTVGVTVGAVVGWMVARRAR